MSTAYRALMARVPTSVVVAAAIVDGQPIGMLVGTFTSVSLEPRLVGFLGDLGSRTVHLLLGADRLSFSVLSRHCHPTVTDAFRRFAEERFDGVRWHPSPAGLPRIDDAVLWVEGPLVDTAPAGDHIIVRVDPQIVENGPGEEPLVFYRGKIMTVGEVAATERVWQLGSIDAGTPGSGG